MEARKKKDGGEREGGRVNDCTIYVFKILIIFYFKLTNNNNSNH